MAEVHSIHSQSDLDTLTSSTRFVIIDFTASWCPPCKAIAPLYANLAKKQGVASGLAFAKVDVDEVPDVTQKYGISAMPSFVFLENGEQTGVDVGVLAQTGGAVLSDGKVSLIRGADPRTLTLVAETLNKIVAPPAPAEGEGEEKKEEVSFFSSFLLLFEGPRDVMVGDGSVLREVGDFWFKRKMLTNLRDSKLSASTTELDGDAISAR